MATPNGKRSRDPEEEEMYLDNYHSHKRYLSEIMASSLNGLTVGDSLTEGLMESPLRDDATTPHSPMSEDSDDARFIMDPPSNSPIISDVISRPTSPGSPHRHQKPLCNLIYSTNPYPLPGCTLPSVVCSQSRQRRSDSEGRFPSSPSDMCHTADLRRAALLRSVQMRTQPTSRENIEEGEDHRDFSCVKSSGEEGGYPNLDPDPDFSRFADAGLHQEDKCFDVGFSSERN